MGLFDKLFSKRPTEPNAKYYDGHFRMLSGYTPRFTTWAGGVYESELIRAAINARATHVSKLKVEIKGNAKQVLTNKLKHAPNQFQTWGQFLYRLSTILDIHNTAFIVPTYDEIGQLSGIYAPLPEYVDLVQYNGVPYLRYKFRWGEWAAMELESCGILTKFQYRNDFFGSSNKALFPTMELIHIQNQGIEEGVKSSATYRFMAQVNNFTKAEDLANERKRFTEENFSREAEAGGLLLFPNTYTNVQQITTKPFVVDADQMKIIKENVFEYFGVNEEVLTSKAYGDAWTAFYESAVEPFAIQFSEVLTKMLFTLRERTEGNLIMATANRLQYMSNNEKLNVSAQLLDRGILTRNEVREIWNLPGIEDGGDEFIIRGEYYNADEKVSEEEEQTNE